MINKDVLEKLAGFLKDITRAWDKAAQDHRNRLCKYLLESIWIKGKMLIGVIPQPEFIPFFDLQYDGSSNYTLAVRPRGGSELLLPENISDGLYPVFAAPPISSHHRIPVSKWPELLECHKTGSLRDIAKDYGVSYEAVRRTISRALDF